jgi:hypothetical protein
MKTFKIKIELYSNSVDGAEVVVKAKNYRDAAEAMESLGIDRRIISITADHTQAVRELQPLPSIKDVAAPVA